MNSMENFFNWMSKTIPDEEVLVWFSVHNMNYEKIELFGDIFKSLNQIIVDTYMGETEGETKITLSQEDKENHFEWCWDKVIDNFAKENIFFSKKGEHYDYFDSFFDETFYNQKDVKVKNSIGDFFEDLFDYNKSFTKSDLDMITNIYKLLDKQIEG